MAVPNASANGLKLFFFSFQAAHAHVRVVADRSVMREAGAAEVTKMPQMTTCDGSTI